MRQLTQHELADFIKQHIDSAQMDAVQTQLDKGVLTELDVRLGHVSYYENRKICGDAIHLAKPESWDRVWIQHTLEHNEPLILQPGQFVLAETHECFKLPKDIKGLFTLRSWAAKSGLDQAVSITLKPRWQGNLIMELRNNLQHISLSLYPLQAIGQVEFFQLDL
ncbi:MAG: dCTP deaminase domain-containing protein [Methylococcaceae bacterium]